MLKYEVKKEYIKEDKFSGMFLCYCINKNNGAEGVYIFFYSDISVIFTCKNRIRNGVDI